MPKARKMTQRTPPVSTATPIPATAVNRLMGDIRSLIEAARAINSALVGLCWGIGTWIRQDVLKEKPADYGERIVQTLSTQLTAQYGRGFGRRNLFRMVQFAESFPDENIVSALSAQLA